MNAATLRLAALAAALIDGEPVDAAECEWVRSYSNRIRTTASKAPRRTGRAEQGRLIVEYAATLSENLSSIAKARRLLRELSNYEATAWIHQRALAETPSGRHGIFWRMLKAYDRVPSLRTIRRRLAKMKKASGGGHDVDPC